jgi:hypothetical protein
MEAQETAQEAAQEEKAIAVPGTQVQEIVAQETQEHEIQEQETQEQEKASKHQRQ